MFPPRSLQWPNGCWPNEAQALLLRACCLQDDAACRRAWEAWRRLTPLDFLDGASLRLSELLHHRLRRLPPPLPDLARLGGIARFQWVRSEMLQRTVVDVLRVLNGVGIETMLLKGAALIATVGAAYPRSMSDVDIVVRRRDVDLSVALLERHGWRPSFREHRRIRHVTHATHLTDRNGDNIDLHWDVFHDRFLTDDQLEEIWAASRPVRFGGQPTRVLCPADQLLQTCEHGARYDDTPPFRWIADACQIVRTFGVELDWARCARLARQHGLVLPVRRTLQYLRQHLALDLPTAAGLLDRAFVPMRDRIAHRVAARRHPGIHPCVRGAPRDVLAYWRLRRTRRDIGLGEFLCTLNDLDMLPEQAFWHFAQLSVTAARTRSHHRAVARRRRKASPVHVITMASDQPGQLECVYAVELHDGQVFRWTEPEATVRLTLAAADYAVVVNTLPTREWPAGTLAVTFNRRPVPCDTADKYAIRFHLSKEMFVDHREQRLVLRCQPWDAAPHDPRRLGLALVDVQFAEVRDTTNA